MLYFSLYDTHCFLYFSVILSLTHKILCYPTRPCWSPTRFCWCSSSFPIVYSLCSDTTHPLPPVPCAVLWVQVSSPQSTCWMILGNSLNISVPQFPSLQWDNDSTCSRRSVRREGHTCQSPGSMSCLEWPAKTCQVFLVPWLLFDFPLTSPGLNQHFAENSLLVSLLDEWTSLVSPWLGPESLLLTVSTQTPVSEDLAWSLLCTAFPSLSALTEICLLPTVTAGRRDAPRSLALSYVLSHSHSCAMRCNHHLKCIVNFLRRSYCKLLKLS